MSTTVCEVPIVSRCMGLSVSILYLRVVLVRRGVLSSRDSADCGVPVIILGVLFGRRVLLVGVALA